MTMMSSVVNFIYFKDYDSSCKFFDEFMEFPCVLDLGWSRVWQIADTSFVGGVDVTKREHHYWQEEKSGLLSFNVPDVEDLKEWHKKFLDAGYTPSELKLGSQGAVRGLSGFHVTGPEGWHLEFEYFHDEELRKVFHGE